MNHVHGQWARTYVFSRYFKRPCARITYLFNYFQHGERYTSAADMWALGAVISFMANEEHLFYTHYKVLTWNGQASPLRHVRHAHSQNIMTYSNALVYLTDKLLSPDPDDRPSARHCIKECFGRTRD